MNPQPDRPGSLTVVGVGLSLGQTTLEAKAHIEQADKVHYLASNPVVTHWIQQLNSGAESLHVFYETGKSRTRSYDAMVERIVASVRQGLKVCAAFYGHPGIFVDPSHRAVRLARSEGYHAVLLPGVSAEDYMFAELGVDPSRFGCQSYEATDFLLHHRRFDPTSLLVLWQVGVIGDITYRTHSDVRTGIRLLLERLLPEYGEGHKVTVYEGSMLPLYPSRILRVPLGELPETPLTPVSTLYVPPHHHPAPDMAIAASLGLGLSSGNKP